MPRDVVLNVVIRTEVMDTFTVRVLDSAQSHGRTAGSINTLLIANTNAVYVLVQEHGGAGSVRMANGCQMLFRARGLGDGACHTVLYHVDLDRLQKSSQMWSRYLGGPGKGGGVGGSGPGSGIPTQ